MPKLKTVKDIAKEAGLDLDDTLLLLWENNLENLLSPDDRIPSSQLRSARVALGLPDIRHIRRPEYWCRLLEIDRLELSKILLKYNLKLKPNARNLPKNGISALRKHSKVIIHPSLSAEVLTDTSSSLSSLSSPVSTVTEPFVWRNIGRVAMDIRFLQTEDVIRIHNALVKEFYSSFEPISPPGVRDMNLLESAIYRPRTALGNKRKYPTVEMAGAALLHAIIHDHPFYDGNKRASFVAIAAFLYRNGFRLTCTEDEAFRTVLLTAKHKLVNTGISYPDLADREMSKLAKWINQHSRKIEKGELVIKWHELKRILRKFEVEMENTGSGGSFIDLTRTHSESKNRRVRKSRQRKLYTQVNFTSDGRDVSRNTISKIRKDLKLDEINGTDSRDFYSKGSAPDMIIHEYQRILNRLAKL